MINMVAEGKRRARLGLPPVKTKMIPLKGTDELHKRMKIAAAEESMTYAQLIDHLLDMREERIKRQRAQQKSPLHRPPAEAGV